MSLSQKETDKLENFISLGLIKSYKLTNISCDGIPDEESDSRNTEQLSLEFPNNQSLIIDTFCSGCLENTTISIS
jgi:hypothetical protein